MYRAKAAGKKQFCLYDMSLDSMAFSASGTGQETVDETIDSDRRYSPAMNELIPAAFRILSKGEDVNLSVSRLLEIVGQRLGVSWVYVAELSEDRRYYSNTFEWCGEEISSQKSVLQNRPVEDLGKDYMKHYNERGILYSSDLSQFNAKTKAFLAKLEIKSVLQCGIWDHGTLGGWVGFADCREQRLWTSDQIDILSFIAELLSTFLLKGRAQHRALNISRDLQALMNSRNTWLYIIDPQTYEILYINAKARGISKEAVKGAVCYRVFLGRESACDDCPAKLARKSRIASKEFYSDSRGTWISAEATLVRWENKDAYLIELRDISAYKENDKTGRPLGKE
ncbi:hypothetical protein [Anaerovorax odorimutans]|uniref:hypothetical protein n=1 Tax=Anaerovorax odorimutans TaxID=109327 RepID=UPI00210AF184|nr:hypothetical protein [Anaerovorax odorimutans]